MRKNMNDTDCRAILPDFLKKFKSEEELFSFVKLVNKHPKELVFCFRGNEKPEQVCIYYKNRCVFRINSKGVVEVNFHHARYSKEYPEYWKKLKKYGFEEMDDEPVIVKKGGSAVVKKTVKSAFNSVINKNIEKIYVECIKKMIDDYFNKECKTDYFRKAIGLDQTGKKSELLEKRRQQQLFYLFKDQKNGFFFYDLEFAQKGKEDSNEPDMLAVRFDKGKPVRLAFVEVKSTYSAYRDKNSGMTKHLERVEGYPKDKLINRVREVSLVMSQYKELELYDIEISNIESEYMKLSKGKIDYVCILTDGAVKPFCRDKSKLVKRFKNDSKEVSFDKERFDVFLPDCKEIEIWTKTYELTNK